MVHYSADGVGDGDGRASSRNIATVKVADPGLFALKNALRAAIAMPLALALSLEVIGSAQMALFASFGSMALIVFADFGGSRRARLRAYTLLVLTGAALIALGTLCSHSAWLATVAMGGIAFAVVFAGVLDGYAAAAQSAALLTFVLPVMVPADASAIPARLAGWGLAALLSIPAVLLLWPKRPRAALRGEAAGAARALAALVQALSGTDRAAVASAHDTARAAILAVRERFVAMPQRPSGTSGTTAGLAQLIEDLGWLLPLLRNLASPDAPRGAFPQEQAAIEAAALQVLRAAAARLDGAPPARSALDLDGLQHAHDAIGRAFLTHVIRRCDDSDRDEATVTTELDEVYRLRQLAYGTLEVGRHALQACGAALETGPSATGPRAIARARLGAARRLIGAHASVRSVGLRNSLRGAAGLALAVLVGQLSDAQHSFWIVLGAMSVLRSNALTTGRTIAWALAGTFAGIVAGGLLVLAAGGHRGVLWALLPFAVLLAAYAPRAISFAAGQAGFTLVVLVLFNLLHPSGWQVGLVRVEDVAIGCAVSLLAGLLMWPRGAGTILREAIGAAYVQAARALDATIDALLGGDGGDGGDDGAARVALATGRADLAAQRLDEIVREYLAERSSARDGLGELARLVAGAARTRRIARLLSSRQTFVRLAPIDDTVARLARARDAFDAERRERCDWYAALGQAISDTAPVPEPERAHTHAYDSATTAPGQVILDGRSPGGGDLPPGLAIAWAHRHLDVLLSLEPLLAQAGAWLQRID
jgi:uncharacterized membrane protein YccC